MPRFTLFAISALVLGLTACGNSGPATDAGVLPPHGSKLVCQAITLPTVHGALGGPLDAPPPTYDWQGKWQNCEVTFKSRLHGSTLYGVLFAPENIDFAHDKLPVVIIDPGSESGVQAQYQWSARELAANGYIALAVDPQGIGNSELVAYPQTVDNYIDAVVSGLDFIESADNPLRNNSDLERMGAAGHSLSAWAISLLQGEDLRLKAIVAWDNLASKANGDHGTTGFGGPAVISDQISSTVFAGEPTPIYPLRPVTPRVPALGEANDAKPGLDAMLDPETKKTAYNIWREAGVPSMEISFAGAAHIDWGQAGTASEDSAGARSQQLRQFQYYTRAWFDLWLKQDRSAVTRLTAAQVAEQPLASLLSSQFRSALYLPGVGIDCPDILAGDCAAFHH